MGSIWGDVVADRERRRRKQRQMEEQFRRAIRVDEERARRAGAVTERAERAELARRDRAEREVQAAQLDAELQAEVAGLTGLLRAAAAEPARNLAAFRQTVPVEEPPRIEEMAGPPQPEWSQFSPHPPAGLFGRRRYERAFVDAEARFERALADHDRQRRKSFDRIFLEYQEDVLRRTREHEARWSILARGVESGDSDAVSECAGEILHASPALNGLFDGWCSGTFTRMGGRSNTCRRSHPPPARPLGPHHIHRRNPVRAAASHPGGRSAPASNPDDPSGRPACDRSYRATILARAWRIASPMTAASTNSDCSAPTASATGQPQPEAGRSAQPALQPSSKLPIGGRRISPTPHHDQRTDVQIN